ncbi:MAG: DNA repair protein RadA [Dehalococcoidia bacterium]
MARTQRGYRCSACGFESAAMAGRCPRCQGWNTFESFVAPRPVAAAGAVRRPRAAVLLGDLAAEPGLGRLATGLDELDRVLGGGLVPGEVVLVGGDPGIGKSTLVLQAAAAVEAAGHHVTYLCGEESPRQVQLRAKRLGIEAPGLELLSEGGIEAALEAARGTGPAVLVVDSIQAVYVEGLDARSGGPAQLSEAAARIVAFAKDTGTAVVMTGHVTKAGEIAGPRLIEHLVDAVLYFESAEHGGLRVLRAVKNRFGATDEVGVFEMTSGGLTSVADASAAFLDPGHGPASGCAVTCVIEGSRPFAVEMQALAVPSYLATPRRVASGFELSRLHLMLAVLAQRGGMDAADRDVLATVSGGIRVRDAGSDLALLVALASAVRDVPLPAGTAFLGEVALSGSIRPAANAARRLAELARLGFRRCLVGGRIADPGAQIELVPVATVREVLAAVDLAAPARGRSRLPVRPVAHDDALQDAD